MTGIIKITPRGCKFSQVCVQTNINEFKYLINFVIKSY